MATSPDSSPRTRSLNTSETSPIPRCDRATPAPSTTTIPADSCPRCCRLYSPRYATRAASGTPVTPTIPHIRVSVSHASGKCREIYLLQPVDGVLHHRVAQPDPQHAAALTHRADDLRRDAQLLREGRDGRRPLGGAADYRPSVRLAEQQLVSRKAQAVSRKIDIEAEARVLVRSAHRDLREGNAETALRAIVGRVKQAPFRPRHEVIDEMPLPRQVHAWGRAPCKAVHGFPQLRPAH